MQTFTPAGGLIESTRTLLDRNEESSYSITAGSLAALTISSLTITYVDLAGNSVTSVNINNFVVDFVGPTPLIPDDPAPWSDGATACDYYANDVTGGTGKIISFACSAAGWYSVTVSRAGTVFGPGAMYIQVLPDRPQALWSTIYAPATMVLGTCSDVFVRMRDAYGNGEARLIHDMACVLSHLCASHGFEGFVDNATNLYQQKYMPTLGARWFAYDDESLLNAAMEVDFTDPSAPYVSISTRATVPDRDAPYLSLTAYAGGGHYRIRSCAIGSSAFFSAGKNYWLRPLLVTIVDSYTHDMVGSVGSPAALAVIKMLSGYPEGLRSSLSPIDLDDVHVSGTGPKLVRLQLADKLGYACDDSAAAIALQISPSDPSYIRGFIRHLNSTFVVRKNA